MIPGTDTSCCRGTQAAPSAGASSAPGISRYRLVQDYHEMVFPEYTVYVNGHGCICLDFSHRATARGSKAEHQSHICHYTADGRDLSGHRLSFLPSKIDYK